jgi:hypothetical protein
MDIDEVDRRARVAGYGDGLVEILAASLLLLMALGWLVNPGMVGILAALVVLYGWKLIDRVRERVTYPRIGYFRERSDDPRSTARGILLYLAGAIAVMVLAIWVSGGVTDAAAWRRAAPLLSGLSLSGGFWYAGQRSGLIHYHVIAVLSVALGLLFWVVGTGDSYAGVGWHLFSLAVPLAVIGVWSLIRFMHAHPRREDLASG